MLFSADCLRHTFCKAGIVDYEVMKRIEHHHCISFSKPAQYPCSSHSGSNVHRHRLNAFVGKSRISLRMGGKGYVYHTRAREMFR